MGNDRPRRERTAVIHRRCRMRLETIVVGYDETPASGRALDKAADLAETFGAKLVVTSAAPVLAHIGRGMGAVDPTDSPQRHEDELAHARAFLSSRKLDADFVPAIGGPADTIVELAEERTADLIVVGTCEAGVLARLFEGSVSEQVS